MTEDSLVYSFMLEYTPSPLRGVEIIRNLAITVNIQCHYPKSDFYRLFSCFFVVSQSRMWFLVCVFQRTHDVSSGLLNPTWSPFSFTTVAEENLHFSLQLMTGGFVMESCSIFFFFLNENLSRLVLLDDWQFPRPSTHFLLGDILKFEASVKQFHHVPLRVSVDSCVATVVPNIATVPRYAFLGNKGSVCWMLKSQCNKYEQTFTSSLVWKPVLICNWAVDIKKPEYLMVDALSDSRLCCPQVPVWQSADGWLL